MKHIFQKVNIVFITLGLSLFFLPLTGSYAAAGCCSHHGGVNGCNTTNNHQLCKDNTTSPTCLCSGGTANATQTKIKAIKKSTTVKSQTTNISDKSPTTSSSANMTTTTTSTKNKTKGCCAKHGGISKCDSATGYQICKDGTHSTTCKC